MSFFKKLFGKKEPEWKTRPHSAPEEKPEKKDMEAPIVPESLEPELAKTNPTKSPELQEQEMQEGIKEMFEESKTYQAIQALNKNNEIKDEDLIKQSLDKIFPRLKRGKVEKTEGEVITMKTKEGEKEVKIPAELMLTGYDSGPDFFTGFAIDHDQIFTMIYRKHLTLSGMTKEELLQLACQNFQNKIGPQSKVTNTIFPGVYQLQTDGNSEASTFLFPGNWKTIQTELKFSKLFLVMPAQNTVLFWDTISEETLKDLKAKVTAVVTNYPRGSIVSNYLYELRDGQFVSLNPFFNIGF